MLSETVLKEIERTVGAEFVTTAEEDLICYSYDATGRSFRPDAVVFPGTAAEVSAVMKLANSEGFAVVPRGAGSGFTGGSLPVRAGVVLSTERMKRIIEVDEANLTCTVEPGVVTWELKQEVEKRGLFYPPDPTSQRFCSIGGNISENAGGPRAVKYGVTRDYVLGLEAVLPTGEVINTGVRTAKGVVGYDLTRLIVGSEGTLAVVTKATLRLLPKPEDVRTLLAVFPVLEDAARAVSDTIGARIVPAALEFMDGVSIWCVREHSGYELPEAEGLLLIELDGDAATVERQAREVAEICTGAGASEVRTATEKSEVKELWKARSSLSPSMFKVKPTKINEDVVVPRSEMVALITGVREIGARHGVTIACFGHAGDGNIHVNIMYDKSDGAEAAGAEAAVTDVFELTLSLGGTISGEHGVGITKAPYLDMELDRASIELMWRLKRAFDPNDVLNPGKIFTAPRARPAGV